MDALTTSDPMGGYPYPSLFGWARIILASLVVSSIMLLIVLGNGLVVLAIAVDRSLAGLQNWFIASLAVSDLLVGLFIMPLSLANELMGYWVFGDALCELWLSTDVLLCTASILNLCLISLDRYWSITRAVSYVRTRTRRRAVTMISVVWVTSMVVCLPPLVGWKRPQPMKLGYPLCVLSEEPGYVVYSIIGSFYLPLALMVAVYYKIYQAARMRARRSLFNPAPTTSSSRSGSERCGKATEMKCLSFVRKGCAAKSNVCAVMSWQDGAEENIQLSEYRSPGAQPIDDCSSALSAASGDEVEAILLDDSVAQTQSAQVHCDVTGVPDVTLDRHNTVECDTDDKRYCSVSRDNDVTRSYFTTAGYDVITDRSVSREKDCHRAQTSSVEAESAQLESRSSTSLLPLVTNRTLNCTSDDCDDDSLISDQISPSPSPRTTVYLTNGVGDYAQRATACSSQKRCHNRPRPTCEGLLPGRQTGITYGSCGVTSSRSSRKARTFVAYETRRRKIKCTLAPDFNFRGALSAARGGGAKCEAVARNNAAVNSQQLDNEKAKRRLARARERRATLVLGVVMASFIGCWLPFFSIYPVTLLAGVSIPSELFGIIFWLGYCNSALNPIIYTIFNREFRAAFHKILRGRR